MVTSEQVVQQVSLQVDAIEPVHRLAQPRKPHDEGGGVDVLASATRGGSRLSHGMRRPRRTPFSSEEPPLSAGLASGGTAIL